MRLIDADWLLDVVENIIDWDTERDKNRIIHQVRELTPPVDTEPKREKWVYQMGMIKCDQCLRAIRRIDHDGLLNFCPNCGADMRGEQE